MYYYGGGAAVSLATSVGAVSAPATGGTSDECRSGDEDGGAISNAVGSCGGTGWWYERGETRGSGTRIALVSDRPRRGRPFTTGVEPGSFGGVLPGARAIEAIVVGGVDEAMILEDTAGESDGVLSAEEGGDDEGEEDDEDEDTVSSSGTCTMVTGRDTSGARNTTSVKVRSRRRRKQRGCFHFVGPNGEQ